MKGASPSFFTPWYYLTSWGQRHVWAEQTLSLVGSLERENEDGKYSTASPSYISAPRPSSSRYESSRDEKGSSVQPYDVRFVSPWEWMPEDVVRLGELCVAVELAWRAAAGSWDWALTGSLNDCVEMPLEMQTVRDFAMQTRDQDESGRVRQWGEASPHAAVMLSYKLPYKSNTPKTHYFEVKQSAFQYLSRH